METIKELRRLLQEEKVSPIGWRRPLGYKLFQRGPSIYLTRLLLPTRVKPNHVTIAGMLLGLGGSYLLLQFDWRVKLLGLFLLYLNILSDKVDGEMARYRKTFSLVGIYWDEINHLLIPPLFWISLTYGLLRIPSILEEKFLIIVSVLGAFSLIIHRVVHSLAAQIYAKKYIKHPEYFPLSPVPQNEKQEKKFFFLRFLHHIQDFFVLVFLTALVLITERVLSADYAFHPLLIYFIIGVSGLLTLFALENIVKKSRTIEKDIAARVMEKRQGAEETF